MGKPDGKRSTGQRIILKRKLTIAYCDLNGFKLGQKRVQRLAPVKNWRLLQIRKR
jgi:hypothetical protein